MRASTNCHISSGSSCFPVRNWLGRPSGRSLHRLFDTCQRCVANRNNCWNACWLHWSYLSNHVDEFSWTALFRFCLCKSSYSQDMNIRRLGRSRLTLESYLCWMWKKIVLLFESGLWIQPSGLSWRAWRVFSYNALLRLQLPYLWMVETCKRSYLRLLRRLAGDDFLRIVWRSCLLSNVESRWMQRTSWCYWFRLWACSVCIVSSLWKWGNGSMLPCGSTWWNFRNVRIGQYGCLYGRWIFHLDEFLDPENAGYNLRNNLRTNRRCKHGRCPWSSAS